MIHPIKEEIFISIYLIVYGIYIVSIYDVFDRILNKFKIKKLFKVILELIFCILQIIITYEFSYELAYGYIPIYFILFMIVGTVIYIKILRKKLIKTIDNIMLIVIIILSKIKGQIIHLFISKMMINVIKLFKNKLFKRKAQELISLDSDI